MLPCLVSSVLFALLFIAILSLQVDTFLSQAACLCSPWKTSYHEKSKKKNFWIFQHMFKDTRSRYILGSYQRRVYISKCVLAHIVCSGEVIQKYFWDIYTFFISWMSLNFFSCPFTRRKKNKCTQKGQCSWKVSNSRWNANLRLKKKNLHWAIRHLEFDFVTQERNFPVGWQWLQRVSVWLLIN